MLEPSRHQFMVAQGRRGYGEGREMSEGSEKSGSSRGGEVAFLRQGDLEERWLRLKKLEED